MKKVSTRNTVEVVYAHSTEGEHLEVKVGTSMSCCSWSGEYDSTSFRSAVMGEAANSSPVLMFMLAAAWSAKSPASLE